MLDRLIDGFLLHRESEGRSAKTLEYHRTSLCLFERWLRQEGLSTDPNECDASLRC